MLDDPTNAPVRAAGRSLTFDEHPGRWLEKAALKEIAKDAPIDRQVVIAV